MKKFKQSRFYDENYFVEEETVEKQNIKSSKKTREINYLEELQKEFIKSKNA